MPLVVTQHSDYYPHVGDPVTPLGLAAAKVMFTQKVSQRRLVLNQRFISVVEISCLSIGAQIIFSKPFSGIACC